MKNKQTARGGSRKGSFDGKRAWLGAASTAALLVSAVATAAPTVNGLFYGDGDSARYSYFSADTNNGELGAIYIATEFPTTGPDAGDTLIYLALVVDESFNDNVCRPTNDQFMIDSGWDRVRSCKTLTDSEYADFGIECGASASSPDYAFSQSYAYGSPTYNAAQALTPSTPKAKQGSAGDQVWFSDYNGSSGINLGAGATPPAGLVQASSMQYNLNTVDNYPGTPYWDVTASANGGATGGDNWVSPDLGADGITAEDQWRPDGGDGFLASGGVTYWEWPMVYEFRFNATDNGCTAPLEISPGTAHHSPSKGGLSDIPFAPTPVVDAGDAPDSYGTNNVSGADLGDLQGPSHSQCIGCSGVVASGQLMIGTSIDFEGEGQVSANAVGDDNGSNDDEDGVTPPTPQGWTVGSSYDVEVTVTNTTGGTAYLCGWVDFDDDGVFENDADERACAVVPVPVSGSTVPVTLSFTIPSDFVYDGNGLAGTADDDGLYYSRYRLTTDWTSAADSSPLGKVGDGEVEDYALDVASLLVRLGYFSSTLTDEILDVTWQTTAEISNLGFEVWGRDGDWRRLGRFIPGQQDDPSLLQSYAVRIGDAAGIDSLLLVDYDDRGRSERFGPFRVGRDYGVLQSQAPTDWRGIRGARDRRLQALGFAAEPGERGRWRRLLRGQEGRERGHRRGGDRFEVAVPGAPGRPATTISVVTEAQTHVAVTADGLQRVSFEDLRDAGLDLRGERVEHIAVTYRGEPVARRISKRRGRFGPGDWLEFYGHAPDLPDSLYVPANLYQVSVDRRRALERGPAVPEFESVMVDRQVFHAFDAPTADPWIETGVRAFGSAPAAVLRLPIDFDRELAPGTRGSLTLELGTWSDFPDILSGDEVVPEHNVVVSLLAPGASEYVEVARESTSGRRAWSIEAPLPEDFLTPGTYTLKLEATTAYAYSRIGVDRYGFRYPSAAETGRREAQEPEVFSTAAPADLLFGSHDLVIVAASAFADSAALRDYADARSEYRPLIVDLEDIYNAFGYGMALPSAITDFLRARDAMHPFSHVQLVGADCFDRLDHQRSGCVSFVPLPTAPVGPYSVSPSQNRLVDFDGDGVGDKAIGQFSVRDEDELAVLVSKIREFDAGLASLESALLVADESDGVHDFAAQSQALAERLDWTDTALLDLGVAPNLGDRATSLAAFRDLLDDGRTLTVFSGHSSTTTLGASNFLALADAVDLGNTGSPTILLPLSCQVTFDIGLNEQVLGHQLLYNPGGAVAIAGAVSLSGLDENEFMAGQVVDGMKRGQTLGLALQAARRVLGGRQVQTLDNWLIQGDVTLRLDAAR